MTQIVGGQSSFVLVQNQEIPLLDIKISDFPGSFIENNEPPPPRFGTVNIASQDLFTANALDKIQKSSDTITYGPDLKVANDKEYNAIRVYKGSYPDLNTISFYKDTNGRINRIGDLHGGPSPADLADLVKHGILKSSALSQLKVTPEEVESARKRDAEQDLTFKRLQADALESLLPASNYQGSKDRTATVLQGEAQFISPKGATQGLHTFGAGPCAVMVVTGKDSAGNVTKVGMAHIDAVTPLSSIQAVLAQAGVNGSQVDVSLISGDRDTALRIADVVRNANANLKFANIDADGQRSDAVTVDKAGNIYYGPRMDLVNIDPQKMELTAISRQIAGQPLQFKNNP